MKIKLIIAAIIPLLFMSCDSIFDKGDVEKEYDGPPVVEFFPLEQERSLADDVAIVKVQLIGEQRDAALPVNFSVSGESTAEAGVHYNLVSASPVTIQAGTSAVDVVIELVAGSLADGEEVLLILNLEGGEGVEASANLARANVYIRG